MAQSVKQKQNSIFRLSEAKQQALQVLARSGCKLGFTKKVLGYEPRDPQKIQIRVDKKRKSSDVITVYLVPSQNVPIYVAHGASRYSAFDVNDKKLGQFRFYIFDIEGELIGDSQEFDLKDYQKLSRKKS